MNLFNDSKRSSKIERAVVEINGGCNYACSMCPHSTGREVEFLKRMPLAQFKGIAEECVAHGASVINLEGSGEPTLNRNLPEYIKVVKDLGAKAYIFSNGSKMRGNLMEEVVDAGIDFYRFSIIGYDQLSYAQHMNTDRFHEVVDNLHAMIDYAVGTETKVASYHLILNNDNLEYELEQYKKINNRSLIEVWKMHNWSGTYVDGYKRQGVKRTCGRPFSPDVVVRAGGLAGRTAAVHPCCQVLGKEAEATLGHLSHESLEEVLTGTEYQKLREGHLSGDYPSYCRDCDFLIEDPEVFVYSNHATLNRMHGTTFKLTEYQ